MKLFSLLLAVLFVLLQYKLWFDEGGISQFWKNKQAVDKRYEENAKLKSSNHMLAAQIKDLKSGMNALEGYARQDLNMIKRGEAFYQIIEPVVTDESGDEQQ